MTTITKTAIVTFIICLGFKSYHPSLYVLYSQNKFTNPRLFQGNLWRNSHILAKRKAIKPPNLHHQRTAMKKCFSQAPEWRLPVVERWTQWLFWMIQWDECTAERIFKVKVIPRCPEGIFRFFLRSSQTVSHRKMNPMTFLNDSMRRINSRSNFQGQGHFKVIHEEIPPY